MLSYSGCVLYWMAVVERGALIWNIYPFTSKYMGNLPFYFKGHEAVPVLVNFRDVVVIVMRTLLENNSKNL